MADISISFRIKPKLTALSEGDPDSPHSYPVGAVSGIFPYDKVWTEADINGQVGPPIHNRQRAVARITGIPDAKLNRILQVMHVGVETLIIHADRMMDDLGDGRLRVLLGDFHSEQERAKAVALDFDMLVEKFPAKEAQLIKLYDTTFRLLPDQIPEIEWSKVRSCFKMLTYDRMATPAEIED